MRVGAIQINAGADPARNLEQADRLVRDAARPGAELIVLPEKWTVLGTASDLRAGARDLARAGDGRRARPAAGLEHRRPAVYGWDPA